MAVKIYFEIVWIWVTFLDSSRNYGDIRETFERGASLELVLVYSDV